MIVYLELRYLILLWPEFDASHLINHSPIEISFFSVKSSISNPDMSQKPQSSTIHSFWLDTEYSLRIKSFNLPSSTNKSSQNRICIWLYHMQIDESVKLEVITWTHHPFTQWTILFGKPLPPLEKKRCALQYKSPIPKPPCSFGCRIRLHFTIESQIYLHYSPQNITPS